MREAGTNSGARCGMQEFATRQSHDVARWCTDGDSADEDGKDRSNGQHTRTTTKAKPIGLEPLAGGFGLTGAVGAVFAQPLASGY
jgi:hypothetical protein